MPLRIPKNQIVFNYTSGKEYIVLSTQKEYQGSYYEINGKFFAGKEFNTNAPEIIKLTSNRVNLPQQNPNTEVYSKLSGVTLDSPSELISIPFDGIEKIRFFIKNLFKIPHVIKEVNKNDFDKVKSNPVYQTLEVNFRYTMKEEELNALDRKMPGIKLHIQDDLIPRTSSDETNPYVNSFAKQLLQQQITNNNQPQPVSPSVQPTTEPTGSITSTPKPQDIIPVGPIYEKGAIVPPPPPTPPPPPPPTPLIYLDASINYRATDLPISINRFDLTTDGWRNRVNNPDPNLYDSGNGAFIDIGAYTLDSDGGGNVYLDSSQQQDIFFGDYISIDDENVGFLDFSGDVSVLMWIKPSSISSPLGLFCNYSYGSLTPGIRLFINTYPNLGDGTLHLEIANQDGDIGDGFVSNSGAITFNQWQQVVLTLSKSKAVAKGYINDQLVVSNMNLATTDWNYPSFTHVGSLVGNYYYDGGIGLVKIFTAELSEDNIKAEFNTNKSRFGL